MPQHTWQFTDSTFDPEVLETTELVLIDFWASWCAPCRVVGPTIDALAREFRGRARVGKVNIDQNPGVAARHAIRSIPTFLIFKGGELVETLVGSAYHRELGARLERHLSAVTAA